MAPPEQVEGSGREALARGLTHIRQMDPGLEEAAFRDWCGNAFLRIQAAWVHRDVESLRPLLGEQMHEAFREQIEELRAKGLLNRLERIVVRAIELTEAWQELGLDPITVHYLASLLDYTVEETSGRIVEGDDRSPVTFDEFWTWTRPVGPNPSRLSAIHQIE
jgi:predicted lipid-binding transport protein (Tim44 family)